MATSSFSQWQLLACALGLACAGFLDCDWDPDPGSLKFFAYEISRYYPSYPLKELGFHCQEIG